MTATRDAVKPEIELPADAWRVVAALIRLEHSNCRSCSGWLDVAGFLEDVAAVPVDDLCPGRLERALRVARLVMGTAGARVRMSALTNPPKENR